MPKRLERAYFHMFLIFIELFLISSFVFTLMLFIEKKIVSLWLILGIPIWFLEFMIFYEILWVLIHLIRNPKFKNKIKTKKKHERILEDYLKQHNN